MGKEARPPGQRKLRVTEYPFTAQLDPVPRDRRELILAIGRRAGSAVVRTRVKRVLRETFRQFRGRFPNGSAVIIAADADLTERPRKAVRLAATGVLNRLIMSWNTGRWRQEKSVGSSPESSGFTS